jgi:hypothetical protein
MLKDLLQITEQVLRQGRVEALLAHPLEQGGLLRHVPFAFGDVPVNPGKDFASVQCPRATAVLTDSEAMRRGDFVIHSSRPSLEEMSDDQVLLAGSAPPGGALCRGGALLP